MPITHTDGATYFSQAELEEKIKDRVRNEQTRYTELETKWKAAEPELAKVSTLAAERDAERAARTKVETRYTAATQFGITDDDTLEALEQAHGRAMSKVPEAQRVGFKDYLGEVKKDPTLLPAYLRNVFAGGNGGGQGAGGQNGQGGGNGGQGGGGQGGTGAGQGGGQNGGQGGGNGQPQRPAWASSSANQQPVQPGNTPSWADKIAGAKSLDELAQVNAERLKARRQ